MLKVQNFRMCFLLALSSKLWVDFPQKMDKVYFSRMSVAFILLCRASYVHGKEFLPAGVGSADASSTGMSFFQSHICLPAPAI